jgi:hypothetical protein
LKWLGVVSSTVEGFCFSNVASLLKMDEFSRPMCGATTGCQAGWLVMDNAAQLKKLLGNAPAPMV